jgi:hypothetical protein
MVAICVMVYSALTVFEVKKKKKSCKHLKTKRQRIKIYISNFLEIVWATLSLHFCMATNDWSCLTKVALRRNPWGLPVHHSPHHSLLFLRSEA